MGAVAHTGPELDVSRRRRFNPIDRALRRLRARTVARFVPAGARVLDVGCGLENWLVRSTNGWDPASLGIDPDLDEEHIGAQGRRADVHEIANEQPGTFDAATSLAVVEHLPVDTVRDHLAAVRATLRPGGLLFLTTPTPRAKPVLELLAFRLHLISAHEIRDHRHYYGGPELVDLLDSTGFEGVAHTPFQFGLNQRVLARRPGDDPA
jgi:2-polyprenyl-3-methyl-5-hydroxy-6-metoxy-1,4-benzoquinol methylase